MEGKVSTVKGRTNQNQRNTPQRKQKEAPKKRRSHFLLILFALLYLPALWNWVFHGSIETDMLHIGLLEIKIPAEGVFIRQEAFIRAPWEGIVIPKADQGERVPNQYTYAWIVEKDNQQSLEKIEKLEGDIIRQVAEAFPGRLEGDPEFRDEVQNEVDKLTTLAVNKSFAKVEGVKNSLEQLLLQRNKEIFQAQQDPLYLKNEKEELEQLQNSLKNASIAMKAEFSGIIVWDASAFDEKYNPTNMSQLTLAELSYQEQETPKRPIQSTGVGEAFSVEKDQSFSRLVDNEKSWYVCAVDNKKAEQLHIGDTLSMKVEGLEVQIPCSVETVEPAGDKTKVTLLFNRKIEETIHLRHAKADLIIRSVTGLKVPVRSLTNRNNRENTADVILVRFNQAVMKKVEIIAEQDSFAMIDTVPGSSEDDPVGVFDIFVVNPKNISEGQVIE